jgi:hypothetical protein
MSYSASGSTITQAGSDTGGNSLGGLFGLAGVTTVAHGDSNQYVMPTVILVVTGNLVIPNAAVQNFVCNRLVIANGGSLTIGSFAADGVTPATDGRGFATTIASGQTNDSIGTGALETQAGSTLTVIGGSISLSGSWNLALTAVIRFYSVAITATRAFGSASLRIRARSANVIMRNCRFYDMGYDMFYIPTEFSVVGFGAEYLFQYVGGSAGGVDAKLTASAIRNTDGTNEFDNYGNGWVELFNCSKGANLLVVDTNSTATDRDKHVVPLFQDINLSVRNLANVVQEDARFRCVDAPVSNSPTATISTRGNLKTWDFRGPITYSGTTNSSGVASFSPALQVWWGRDNLKNLRFPSSTATIRICGYALKQQDFNVVLGSDSAIALNAGLSPVSGLTITESAAAALTGLALTASGSTAGTATISGTRTLADLWHFYRQWIAAIANFGSNDTWDYDPALLDIAGWSISISGAFTGNLKSLNATTITGALTTTGSQFGGVITSNSSLTLAGCTFASGTTINTSAGAIAITVDLAQIANITAGSNVTIRQTPVTLSAPNLTSAAFDRVQCRVSLAPGGPINYNNSTGARVSGGNLFVSGDVNLTANTITIAGVNGKITTNSPIRVGGTDLPVPLDPLAVYYPAGSYTSGNAIPLSGTPGGAAIDLIDTGTGDRWLEVWTELASPLITSGSLSVDLTGSASTAGVSLSNGDFIVLQAAHWKGSPQSQVPCTASEYFQQTFQYGGTALVTLAALESAEFHNQICVIRSKDGSQVTEFLLDASAPGKIQLDTGVTEFSTFDAALFFYYARQRIEGLRLLRNNIQIIDLNNIKVVGELTIDAQVPAIGVGPHVYRADGKFITADESQRVDWRLSSAVGVPIRVEVPVDLSQGVMDMLAAIASAVAVPSAGGSFNPATDPVIVGSIQSNVITADALAADAVAEIRDGVNFPSIDVN